MIKNLKIISLGILLLSIFSIGVFALNKTGLSPSVSSSTKTFHSLNDLYNLALTGSTSTPSSSVSTTSFPLAASSHSTSEIYALLANMVKQEKLWAGEGSGFTLLGVTGVLGNGAEEPDLNYVTVTPIFAGLNPINQRVAQGYSLEDIYNLIVDNTRITSSSHDLTKTSSPSASMYTIDEVYDELSNLITSLRPRHFAQDVTYLGVQGALGECSSGSDCSGNPRGEYCVTDSFNGYAFYCDTGSAGQGCQDDSSCNADLGLVCDAGNTYQCIEYYYDGICVDNSDCSSGWCNGASGMCKDVGDDGTGCYFNNQCESGICISDEEGFQNPSYICATTCLINTDCGVDGFCDSANNICTNGLLGASCGADGNNECAPGFDCLIREYSCSYLPPCPSGYSDAGAFYLNEGSSICVLNGSIAGGESCLNNANCAGGYCDTDVCASGLGDGGSCESNGDCASGICNDWECIPR